MTNGTLEHIHGSPSAVLAILVILVDIIFVKMDICIIISKLHLANLNKNIRRKRRNIPVEYEVFNVHNVLKVVYIHIALNVTTREKHSMTNVTNVVKAALMFISSGVLALSYL